MSERSIQKKIYRIFSFETIFAFIVQCSTLIWALLLPSVGTSLYFYSANQLTETGNIKNVQNVIPHTISTVEDTKKRLDCEKTVNAPRDKAEIHPKFSASLAFAQLSIQFKTSYSNPEVIKWSIWWAIAMCGYLQVIAMWMGEK